MAAIFYVSSLPQPPLPPGGDKPWHLVAYLAFGVVVVRAFAGGLPSRIGVRVAASAVALSVAYAITDEVHQMFVPGRSAQLTDLFADAIGICVGTSVCWGWGIISASRDEL